MSGPKLGCIILGSGGIVSQRFQQRLSNHPFFELAGVVGSSNSIGNKLLNLPWVYLMNPHLIQKKVQSF